MQFLILLFSISKINIEISKKIGIKIKIIYRSIKIGNFINPYTNGIMYEKRNIIINKKDFSEKLNTFFLE
jgi:hypothetical protein